MIDYHKQLVSELSKILPVHYEMRLTSNTKTPCISYMELSNVEVEQGDTIGYSTIVYQIKVWGHDLGELQTYSLAIDQAMRSLGFKRISCNELYDRNSTLMQKIFSYEAFAFEKY